MIDPLSRTPTARGEIQFFLDFPSRFVQSRTIEVWLPPGYGSNPTQGYSVIYAQDGQNLFNPNSAFAGVDWGLHEALLRLRETDKIRDTLVVGIWNTPLRYREYDPQRVFDEYLTPKEKMAYDREYGRPLADDYLKFLVKELKPFIDNNFQTRPKRTDSFLLGSSMGGMISAYALCEYPQIFGGAGCLSTHWPAVGGKMVDYLASHLPAPRTHKFYFDFGTETIDAQYEPFQRQVDEVFQQKGYQFGLDWMSRKFPGDDHSERSWRNRIDIPLQFLLNR